MSLFVIIGSPWVNPLIDYPYNLKNVIEWNFFLISILFYLPMSVLLYNLKINLVAGDGFEPPTSRL